ncbi:transglycosylase domain-containing protein [Streptomyces sp. NPDC059740]|uniref:transglycosylase domain-containing protein n=1 Tax=Streptomyces sp. NPDC059740 TaxID=3346926 RepID=UPI00364DFE63
MSDPHHPGTSRNGPPGWDRRPPTARRRRTGWRRLIPTWRMWLGAFLLLVFLLAGGLAAGYLLVDIPPANANARAQSNVYLYADGSPLAHDGNINRENVPLHDVPDRVQHAVLAAEDRDFYSESAVDPAAMIRAAWNTLTGKGKQSGSTITQQYVKNYYLGQEQTLTRKAKEFFIAIKLDNEVGKDDILEGYLNTSYYGRNAYGIQAAARAYYDKDADELTVGEGAYLAALLNAPSIYDLTAHPENRDRALARWNYVLDGMVKKKWLSSSERRRTTFPDPHAAKTSSSLSGQRGYLVEAVRNYLAENHVLDEGDLHSGGYRITTTIEPPRQKALLTSVKNQLTAHLGDSRTDSYVRAGAASVDPGTGRVIALYGGKDYAKQYVNSATRRDYQVGSTFKPIVLASAIANGAKTQDGQTITPNTRYDGRNKRMTVHHGHRTGFAPANEDDRSYGQITVTEATDRSVNAVYAQMGVDVGPEKVKDTAVALGVPRDVPGLTDSQAAIALGTATPSVLDMTQAYATLAAHGQERPYTLVDKVERDGRDVRLPDRAPRQAIPREAADTTTAVLRSVVESKDGTGSAARAADRPAAGKTGTAEDDKAAWFAGYTPDLATVVAVLGQNPQTARQEPLYGAGGQKRVNGGGYPAQIWADYTAAALRDRSATDFDLQLAADASPEPYDASSSSPGSSPSGSPGESPGTEPSEGPEPPGEPRPSGEQPPGEPTGGPQPPGGGNPPDGGEGTTGGEGTVPGGEGPQPRRQPALLPLGTADGDGGGGGRGSDSGTAAAAGPRGEG